MMKATLTTTIIKYLLIAGIGLSLYLWYKEYRENKRIANRFDLFMESESMPDTNIAIIKKMVRDEFREWVPGLIDTLRKQGIKEKQINNYYQVANHYGDTFTIELKDTIIKTQNAQSFMQHDGYLGISGMVFENELFIDWELYDTLDIVGYWKRQRINLLLFKPKWGKKKAYIKVNGKCPNAKYIFNEAIELGKE